MKALKILFRNKAFWMGMLVLLLAVAFQNAYAPIRGQPGLP